MSLKTVSPSQFWSKEFTLCCFIPLAVLTALQIAADNYWGAAWQAVTLVILCVNNYLLCSNHTLKKELLEQLQVNLALIQSFKDILKKEESENHDKSNRSDRQPCL